MNNTPIEILSKRGLIEKFCKKNGIIFLGVFGSFARNETKEESDIDILAKFEHIGGLLEFIRVEYELSDLLGRKVDLVEEKGIPNLLKERIEKEIMPIYERRR